MQGKESLWTLRSQRVHHLLSEKKKKVRKRQKKFGNEEPPFFADSPHFCLRKRRSLCFWLEKSGLSISPGQLAGQKQLSTVLEGLGLPLCGHHGKVCDGACRWPSPLSPHPLFDAYGMDLRIKRSKHSTGWWPAQLGSQASLGFR